MSNELEGATAILAIPTYGHVDPILQKKVRMAMMTAANRGLKWVGDVSVDKVGWGASRNMTAQALLDLGGEADGCMWIDSDIEVPYDAIARLIDSANRTGAHVISGVYHKKGLPFTPVVYHFDKQNRSFKEIDDYSPNSLIAPGGCGFGFVWTSYAVISTISMMPDFDAGRGGWFPDTRYTKGGLGEDFAFCAKVHDVGEDVYVDTGVQLGHQGNGQVFYESDFRRTIELVKKGELVLPEPPKWGIE